MQSPAYDSASLRGQRISYPNGHVYELPSDREPTQDDVDAIDAFERQRTAQEKQQQANVAKAQQAATTKQVAQVAVNAAVDPTNPFAIIAPFVKGGATPATTPQPTKPTSDQSHGILGTAGAAVGALKPPAQKSIPQTPDNNILLKQLHEQDLQAAAARQAMAPPTPAQVKQQLAQTTLKGQLATQQAAQKKANAWADQQNINNAIAHQNAEVAAGSPNYIGSDQQAQDFYTAGGTRPSAEFIASAKAAQARTLPTDWRRLMSAGAGGYFQALAGAAPHFVVGATTGALGEHGYTGQGLQDIQSVESNPAVRFSMDTAKYMIPVFGNLAFATDIANTVGTVLSSKDPQSAAQTAIHDLWLPALLHVAPGALKALNEAFGFLSDGNTPKFKQALDSLGLDENQRRAYNEALAQAPTSAGAKKIVDVTPYSFGAPKEEATFRAPKDQQPAARGRFQPFTPDSNPTTAAIQTAQIADAQRSAQEFGAMPDPGSMTKNEYVISNWRNMTQQAIDESDAILKKLSPNDPHYQDIKNTRGQLVYSLRSGTPHEVISTQAQSLYDDLTKFSKPLRALEDYPRVASPDETPAPVQPESVATPTTEPSNEPLPMAEPQAEPEIVKQSVSMPDEFRQTMRDSVKESGRLPDSEAKTELGKAYEGLVEQGYPRGQATLTKAFEDTESDYASRISQGRPANTDVFNWLSPHDPRLDPSQLGYSEKLSTAVYRHFFGKDPEKAFGDITPEDHAAIVQALDRYQTRNDIPSVDFGDYLSDLRERTKNPVSGEDPYYRMYRRGKNWVIDSRQPAAFVGLDGLPESMQREIMNYADALPQSESRYAKASQIRTWKATGVKPNGMLAASEIATKEFGASGEDLDTVAYPRAVIADYIKSKAATLTEARKQAIAQDLGVNERQLDKAIEFYTRSEGTTGIGEYAIPEGPSSGTSQELNANEGSQTPKASSAVGEPSSTAPNVAGKTGPAPTEPPKLSDVFPPSGVVELNSGLNIPQMLGYSKVNPELGPRMNVSNKLAFRDLFVENLSQLEKIDPDAATEARRAAASNAEAAVLIRGAVPKIEDATGSKEGWTNLRTMLVESRLRGLRERWGQMADSVETVGNETPSNIGPQKALSPEMENPLKQLTDAWGNGMRGIAERLTVPTQASLFYEPGFNETQGKQLAPVVDALLSEGKWEEARDTLAASFRDAQSRVGIVMAPDDFTAALSDEGLQKGLAVYKDLLEKPMAQSHALNDGVFSTALGPLDTYIPLIPETEPTGGLSRFRRYKKPTNIHNRFATGLASSYDLSVEGLQDSLRSSIRSNNIASLIDTLNDNGLVKLLTPSERAALGKSPTFTIDGVEYPATIKEIQPPGVRIVDGRKVTIPGKVALVPRWLSTELTPILEGDNSSMAATKFVNALNTATLAGPTDAVFHTWNVLGTLISGTPFVGESVAGKVVGGIPILKTFKVIADIIHADTGGPQAISDLREMAQLGVLPEKYGSVTTNKALAESTGAKRSLSFGTLLYGPNGIDVRSRIVMYRLAKSINPEATPTELKQFIGQLGVYNQALSGTVERGLKKTGLAPFYTAGKTMLINGLRAWSLSTPLPTVGKTAVQRLGLRAAQAFSGGAPGLVAAWAVMYKAYTDKWPWQDDRARFLQIPLNDDDRNSELGKIMYGDNKKTAYVGLGIFNPIVERGARSLGISGAFQTAMRGGTVGQSAEKALADITNSFAHPVTSSPLLNAVSVGVFGKEPYISGFRDSITGNYGPQLLAGVQKKAPGFGPGEQFQENLKRAIVGMNPSGESIAEATGLMPPVYQDPEDEGNSIAKALVDLLFPRFVKGTEDVPKSKDRLERQRERSVPTGG